MTDTQDSQSPSTVVATPIIVNFDNKLDVKQAKFGFRSVKDEKTGVETRRAAVELDKIQVPSVEGIIAILNAGGPALLLLQEAVADVVYQHARDVINASDSITSENFDYSVLDWNAIANLEKEDRRSAIPKETWDDFAADYASIMPAISGITKEQAVNTGKILVGKFASIKSKKDIIAKLKLRVAMYAENSPRAVEFADIIETLFKRADKLIEAKEENLENNLGLD